MVQATSTAVYDDGFLYIDPDACISRVEGVERHFSELEFQILLRLTERAGVVCTHRDILIAGWGQQWWIEQYLVRWHIKNIRRKLGKPGVIKNVLGVGYRYDPPWMWDRPDQAQKPRSGAKASAV